MIEEFNKYTDNYDRRIKEIKRKYNHSLRVMNLAKKYSKLLNFNQEEIKLATLIGLLHDIGRFEQFKIYHTYNDSKSIDHADYGVKILFEDKVIERFITTNKYNDIIAFAIQNHNKLSISNNYKNKKMLRHAKLIRDVDKIDIILIAGKLHEIKRKATNEDLSPNVLECIKKHKSIPREYIKNKNDRIAMYFAFAFDINYNICLKEIKRNLIYLYKEINDKHEKIKKVYEESINYLDNRINTNK